MSHVWNNRLWLSSRFRNGPFLSSVSEGLQEYFSKFGDLKECLVMRDPNTKQSR